MLARRCRPARQSRTAPSACIPAARMLHAVTDLFLVNIQADVIHLFHEEPPWFDSELALALSSAFLPSAPLTYSFKHTGH